MKVSERGNSREEKKKLRLGVCGAKRTGNSLARIILRAYRV